MNEIIIEVELLYVVLCKIDLEKHHQMFYLRYILIITREETRKAFTNDLKSKQYLYIIDHMTEVHIDQDIK